MNKNEYLVIISILQKMETDFFNCHICRIIINA